MKPTIAALFAFSILFSLSLSAHREGHDHSLKTWIVDGAPTLAEFVKYEDEKVYLLDAGHQLSTYALSRFPKNEQRWFLETTQRHAALNHMESPAKDSRPTRSSFNYIRILLAALIVLFLFVSYRLRRKTVPLAFGAIGLALIAFVGCETAKGKDNDEQDTNNASSDIPANDVHFMTSIFEQFDGVNTNSDNEWFYISSNGIPAHNRMIGITNWQQQVPIDQDYSGDNSWAIPIQPELSDSPLSTKTNLLKGAIAIAVNGIPIFNPLNNRSEDANEIGELDQWGGHCGRADDYHYHIPPAHLQTIVGSENPIAYAVDGFPIYGETTELLDECLGRFNADGAYQYHTVQEYPYFIASMRGKVTLDPRSTAPENQVIPQAMTRELRPATAPLRGAVITDFASKSPSSHSLKYTLDGETFTINYSWDANGLYTYEFVNPDGTVSIETYQR